MILESYDDFLVTSYAVLLFEIVCVAKFVLPGRPQTYKPPRHRYGQKHFYCGHKKEIKAARKALEESWGSRESLHNRPVKLVIRACGNKCPAFWSSPVPLQERPPSPERPNSCPESSRRGQPRQVRSGRPTEKDPHRRQDRVNASRAQALVPEEEPTDRS